LHVNGISKIGPNEKSHVILLCPAITPRLEMSTKAGLHSTELVMVIVVADDRVRRAPLPPPIDITLLTMYVPGAWKSSPKALLLNDEFMIVTLDDGDIKVRTLTAALIAPVILTWSKTNPSPEALELIWIPSPEPLATRLQFWMVAPPPASEIIPSSVSVIVYPPQSKTWLDPKRMTLPVQVISPDRTIVISGTK
jgi:hypothetical protein